jgi:hypothetical protein
LNDEKTESAGLYTARSLIRKYKVYATGQTKRDYEVAKRRRPSAISL